MVKYCSQEEGVNFILITILQFWLGIPIYIQKKLYPITYKGFDFISYNL